MAPVRAAPANLDLLQVAIMVFASVSVWRIQDLYPALNTVKIQYIAPAFALLAFTGNRDPRRYLKTIDGPLVRRLLGIMLMIAVSVPFSLWPGKSFNFMINDHAKTIALMVLVAASIRSLADIERYAMMHIGGAALYSYYVNAHFRVSLKSGRLGDLIYYDANDLGLLLVCTIPLCVYFIRPAAKLYQKIGATAALGMIVYTMVQTGSRGAFIAFIGCSAYLLVNFTAISKAARGYAVGLLVALLMFFGGDRYWEMMSTLLNPTQDYNWTNDSGRKAVWKRGIGYMVTHPITGVGARAFGQAEGTISGIAERQSYGIGVKWSAAHNSFIEVGAELGFIGIGLFLTALYLAFRFVRAIGAKRHAARAGPLGPLGHALGGVLVAYCFAGFFVSAGYSAFLYTVFGMIIGMMKVSRGVLSGPIDGRATEPKVIAAARPTRLPTPAGVRLRGRGTGPLPAP